MNFGLIIFGNKLQKNIEQVYDIWITQQPAGHGISELGLNTGSLLSILQVIAFETVNFV